MLTAEEKERLGWDIPRLKRWRTLQGYTQAQVARMLCVSPQTYLRWENSRTTPSQSNIDMIRVLYTLSPAPCRTGRDLGLRFLPFHS